MQRCFSIFNIGIEYFADINDKAQKKNAAELLLKKLQNQFEGEKKWQT